MSPARTRNHQEDHLLPSVAHTLALGMLLHRSHVQHSRWCAANRKGKGAGPAAGFYEGHLQAPALAACQPDSDSHHPPAPAAALLSSRGCCIIKPVRLGEHGELRQEVAFPACLFPFSLPLPLLPLSFTEPKIRGLLSPRECRRTYVFATAQCVIGRGLQAAGEGWVQGVVTEGPHRGTAGSTPRSSPLTPHSEAFPQTRIF